MKKVTLNNEQRHQICLKKQNVPNITQKELTAWCEQEFGAKVDQATVSRTLKRSSEYLNSKANSQQYKTRSVKCPELEHELYAWCLHSQDHIPLTDLIIIEKAKTLAKMLNISDGTLSFSTGWLQSFKNRNNLKTYQLHGKRVSADIGAIESDLPDLEETQQSAIVVDRDVQTITNTIPGLKREYSVSSESSLNISRKIPGKRSTSREKSPAAQIAFMSTITSDLQKQEAVVDKPRDIFLEFVANRLREIKPKYKKNLEREIVELIFKYESNDSGDSE